MQLSQIETRRLTYFVAVAENLSFRAAAAKLHISQPPLTRQIQTLEDILGVKLFNRLPRGVELTAAGAVFYEDARNILSLIQQSISRAQLAGQGQLGRLDVGSFGTAVLNTVPRIMLAFRSRYPKVEVVLHNMARDEQVQALRERRLTVGFNRFFEDEPGLTWETIKTEHLMLAINASHTLSTRDALSLDDLDGIDFIAYPRTTAGSPGFSEFARSTLTQRGVEPASVLEVDDVLSAISLVSGGFGVCLVTESASVLQLPEVVYKPLREADQLNFDLAMIYREDDDSRLLEAFISEVRAMSQL